MAEATERAAEKNRSENSESEGVGSSECELNTHPSAPLSRDMSDQRCCCPMHTGFSPRDTASQSTRRSYRSTCVLPFEQACRVCLP